MHALKYNFHIWISKNSSGPYKPGGIYVEIQNSAYDSLPLSKKVKIVEDVTCSAVNIVFGDNNKHIYEILDNKSIFKLIDFYRDEETKKINENPHMKCEEIHVKILPLKLLNANKISEVMWREGDPLIIFF